MTVTAIGTGSASNTAALDAQLKADQKNLVDAKAKKASKQTITADQAKVTADQRAIARAATGQAKTPEKSHGIPSSSEAAGAKPGHANTAAGLDISV
jgi:hypothetical protein